MAPTTRSAARKAHTQGRQEDRQEDRKENTEGTESIDTRKTRKAPCWDPEMEPKTRKARKAQTQGRHRDPEDTDGKAVNGGGLEVEAPREQVFPGLPDDISMVEIAPKLPWKSLCMLAAVSPAWLHAVQSREVYDARVLFGSLESLLLFRYGAIGSFGTVSLYSTKDGFYFKLPLFPGCERGISHKFQCVLLDGKIYALGPIYLDFCLVYVLDLAGRRQWKQCASMRQKAYFRCAALDGKLYVYGNDRISEVYDPKADTWSPTKPIPSRRRTGPITAVGEELFSLQLSGTKNQVDLDDPTLKFAFRVDIYHPAKGKWRVEKFYSNASNDFAATLFSTKGKLYRVKDGCISVLNMDRKRWMLKHRYSFAGCGLLDDILNRDGMPYYFYASRKCFRAVGDELFAMVRNTRQTWILQSEGFGGDSIDIAWHIFVVFPFKASWDDPCDFEMYTIDL